MKFNSLDQAATVFIDSAIIQDNTSKTGDYKTGNKAAEKIRASLKYIWQNNPYFISKLLDHENGNVRNWTAMFWLSVNEEQALKVLEDMANSKTFYAMEAKYCIIEWKNGNLTSDQWEG